MNANSQTEYDESAILKSYFSFQGRIDRSTYWLMFIPLYLASIGLATAFVQSMPQARYSVGGLLLAAIIFYVPMLWIVLATYAKRWHDLNASGWLTLTLFILYINILIILLLGVLPGKSEPNRYGEKPFFS